MGLPIRLRLTLVFTAGMAVVLLVLGTVAYVRFRSDLLDAVDMGLRSRAQVIVDAVERRSDSAIVDASGPLIDPDEAFAQVLDRVGRVLETSSGVADVTLLDPASAEAVAAPTFATRDLADFDDPVRLLAVPVSRVGKPAIVVVGSTLGDLNDAVGGFLVVLLGIGPAALFVTAAGGWLLAGAALGPTDRMRREAAAISASEPARRLHVPATRDELARLAETLNGMLDRLQEALERERRFVDDASHELRTPLATLRAEIDLALARTRDAGELEDALRRARGDVAYLQRVSDDLLVLARARGGRVPVRPVAVSLGALLEQSVQSVAAAAAEARIRIDVSATDQQVLVDPDRVRQALANVLDNAIRQSPAGGSIRLSVDRRDGEVTFVVDDDGPGFSADLLDRAFEPFVHDPAGAGGEGTGLGLAIVRAVAEAHGGSVRAENLPSGARITLTLRG
jgi:two-component system, OmpR family, sensor kinase